MEIRKVLSYRMDFWSQFLGSLLAQFGVAWFLWQAIYTTRGVDHVGAFSFTGMMLYYLAAPLAARMVQGGEMGDISEEIYNGTLTRYLVYPVSFFRYKLAAATAYVCIFAAQFALVMTLFAFTIGIPSEFSLSPASVAGGLACLLVAAYLNFVLVATLELIAFWADNVWSLVVIMRFLTSLLGGAMLPLALFPDWAHALLYRMPFAYLIAFPVETLLGLTSPARWVSGMLVVTAWAVVCTLLYRLVWERGQHQYSGVGI
ncbi:MAG: ABC-2 family transporter protein [Lentisphaerae bacterium]|nr:ABC-2 family transporter protein [Lentisphaerota bacterium]